MKFIMMSYNQNKQPLIYQIGCNLLRVLHEGLRQATV